MTSTYIKPNIIKVREEWENENYSILDPIKNYELHEILDEQHSFILGGPGYGKSRLLKELFNKSIDTGVNSIIVDLKKIEAFSIDELTEWLNELDVIDSICETNIECKNFSENLSRDLEFSLFLDSLDELSKPKVIRIYELVGTMVIRYPNMKILIASRTGHFKRYKIFMKIRDFIKFEIKEFNSSQLNDYLKCNQVALESIERISSLKLNSILIPRYLGYLVQIAMVEVEKLSKISKRKDILELVVLSQLEDSNNQEFESIGTISVLCHIALAMEIRQINEISKEDVLDFFEYIESKVCERYFYKHTFGELFNKTIFRFTEDLLQFENHEIQEYLASRLILKNPNLRKFLFELVANSASHEISASWFNTISYVLEDSPEIFLDIANYIYSDIKIYNNNAYSLINDVDLSKIEDKKACETVLFSIIKHSQHFGLWIDWGVQRALAKHLNEEMCLELISQLDFDDKTDKRDFRIGNIVLLIGEYIELQTGNTIEDPFKSEVIQFCSKVLETTKHTVSQRHSIPILASLCDIGTFISLKKEFDLSDELVVKAFINACSKFFPNENFSIDAYFKFMQRFKYTFEITNAISKISSNEGLRYLIYKLKNDNDCFDKLIEITRKDGYTRNIEIIIGNDLDNETLSAIEDFLYEIFNKQYGHMYYIEKSTFFIALLKIYDDHSEKGSFDLIKESRAFIEHQNPIRYFDDILISIASCKNILKIIEAIDMNEKENDKSLFQFFFDNLRYNDFEKYEYLSNLVKDTIGRGHIYTETADTEDKKTLIEFKSLLKLNEAIDRIQSIKFFWENKEELIVGLESDDKIQILSVVKDYLNQINVNNFKIEYNDGGYSITGGMGLFELCIKIMNFYGESLCDYRNKLIQFVPFAETNLIPILVREIGNLNVSVKPNTHSQHLNFMRQ